MNRRALVISAVVAALGAVLLYLYLERFEEEASGGTRVQVLVANEPIERGDPITEEMLAVREIPIAYVEDRAIKATERAKIVGLRVGNRVDAQQTLFWTDLEIASDERRELSSLVEPGNRAVFIQAESGDKTTLLIRPGDYVDVLVNLPTESGDKRKALVLLQKVLVLSVGGQTKTQQSLSAGKKAEWSWGGDNIIALSVGLREAQLLTLAREKGVLQVALRNPEDPGQQADVQGISSDSLTESGVKTVIGVKATGPAALEVPE